MDALIPKVVQDLHSYRTYTQRYCYLAPGVTNDTMPSFVVRRVTQPDIPDAIGKNLEEHSWIIVPTWSGNTKGTRAGTKSIGALKMCKSR